MAVTPRPGKAVWMLWVISHPELVEATEAERFDVVFAASRHWSRSQELQAIPLLQATNPTRFSPASDEADTGANILFVGSTRGEFRPIVRDAIAAGADISLYGVGWEEFVAPELISGEFISNTELPHAYATAGIVLNDHWTDMAAEGFLSNRLFDAAATGTRVLSDEATGLREVFGDVVRTYREPEELANILGAEPDTMFADREARLALAATVAREHSFDARAVELIAQARRVTGR
jgi:spore maturation protein CgeB